MFRKVLVANRGEIAVRAFRAATELGAQTVAVFPHEDRKSEHRPQGGRGLPDRRAGAPGPGLPRPAGDRPGRRRGRRRRDLPRLRLPLGEPRCWPRPATPAGITFIGPPADVLHLTGNKARAIAAAREAGLPTLRGSEPSDDVDAVLAAAAEHRLPGLRQGGRRRRRARHAAGRARGGPARVARGRACARRRRRSATPRVFLEQAVVSPRHIEVQVLADARRQRHPPVRARLLGAAAAPEGRRDRARRPNLDPETARADVRRTPSRSPATIGYVNAGHGRVPARPGRPLRLHRDEPPHPGRAHGDRGGHRRRPGQSPRCGSPPARPCADLGLTPGRHPAARRRAAVPDHHRGPRQRLPPGHRHGSPSTARPAARACGSTAARSSSAPRSAPTSTRCWSSSPAAARTSRSPCAARAARWPSSGSAGSRPTSRSCRRCSTEPDFWRGAATTSLHRRATRAARRRGSAPTAAPSCSPTSPTSRSTSRTARSAPRSARAASCPRIDLDAPPPPGARDLLLRVGPAEFAAAAARSRTAVAGHRHDLPRRPPVARSPPGCAPATCSTSPGTWLAPHPAAAQRGGVGRGDVRRRAALPRRGPLGAARRAARGDAQHAAADAAARPQHRRLHAVPDRGHRRVRARGRPHRHRHLPDLRLAQRRRRRCARPSRRCSRPAPRSPRWRCATPATCSTRDEQLYTLDYYLRPGRADRRQPAPTSRHQGHGRAAARAGRGPAGHRAARAVRPAGAPAHPRHRRRPDRPPCSPRSTPASTPSTPPAPRCRAPPASRRMSALVAATDGTERPTGLDIDKAVCDLEPYWEAVRQLYAPVRVGPAPPPPAASTSTRSPAASCRTCASRRSRSASATGSRRSRTCTPPRTASWATSSR